MTLNKGLKLSFAGIFAASLITACGTDANVLTSALDGNNLQELAYSAKGTQGQFGPGQRSFSQGKMGPGQHGPEGFANVAGNLFAELDLSDEQMAALKDLRESNKPDQATPPDEAQRAEVKTLIETAFVSDNFDAAALEAQLAEYQPQKGDRLTQQAEIMVASWNILTEEQKSTLKTKQAERQAQFAEMADKLSSIERPERPEIANVKGNNRMAEILSLSDEQVTALEALKGERPERPDPTTMKAQVQATQTAIQAELDKDSPSVAAIVAILEANRPEQQASPVAHLAELHSILTAEQRQAFVDAGLAGNQGPQHEPSGGFGRPGAGSKMGPGGPGFGPQQGQGGHPGFSGGEMPHW